MQTIEISSWSDYKDLIDSKKLLIQFEETDSWYRIYAAEGGVFIWKVSLQKETDDAEDFEQNFKAGANKPLEYRSVDGLLKVANSKFADQLSFYIAGLTPLSLSNGNTGYIKYAVPEAYTLSGTHVNWKNCNCGDTITFEVGVYTDSNNEETFISLNKFASNFQVIDSGSVLIDVPTVKIVPATIDIGYGTMQVYIRIKCVNGGENSSIISVNLVGWK